MSKNEESITDLENRYQKLLSEYSRMHKIYMDDVMDFLKSEKNKYLNKIIETPNGNKYYVNNSGYARKIINNNILNSTCGDITKLIKVNTNNLTDIELILGNNLGDDEVCGLDGKNVKVNEYNSESKYMGCFTDKPDRALSTQLPGEYSFSDCKSEAKKANAKYFALQDTTSFNGKKAQCFLGNSGYDKYGINENCVSMSTGQSGGGAWANAVYQTQFKNKSANSVGYINEEGILRKYPENIIKNNTGTCPNNIEYIDEGVWEKFKQGKEMQIDTLCNLGNIDSNVKEKLNTMNKELLEIADEIKNKINENESEINNINKNRMPNIKNEMKNVQGMFNRFEKMKKREKSVNAMMNDQLLRERSTNIEYVFWLGGSLTLLYLIYSRMK